MKENESLQCSEFKICNLKQQKSIKLLLQMKESIYRNFQGSFEVVFENGFLWKRVFFILLLELCCENQTT